MADDLGTNVAQIIFVLIDIDIFEKCDVTDVIEGYQQVI